MRKQEIQKLEIQEKELRGTLRNLQRLIKQAEEKLEEAKKEAASIIESAKAKANEWLEKINIRLGLIPMEDIEDKRREIVGYYKPKRLQGSSRHLNPKQKEKPPHFQ